jgi:hypothetical protein
MIDLESLAGISRVHLYPRVMDRTIGHNFPIDFEISISDDGKSFEKALLLTGYKVTSVRDNQVNYVWDPGLNDYKKAEGGQETGDLSLSGAGRKSSADYPQYFVLPAGSKGRYLKITGTKLKDEKRMQFMEVEVYGSK